MSTNMSKKNKGKNKSGQVGKNKSGQVGKNIEGGNPGITYILNRDEPKTFNFIKSGKPDEIIYYDGVIHYADKLVEMEASFVCFEELEHASIILKCARRINHPSVLRAYFYCFDSDICKSLVCFEKFDCFLCDIPPPYLTYLKNPTCYSGGRSTVTGNPNDFIQSQIREINDALMKMHTTTTTVSSSKLDLEIGYFWCAQDKTVKIMADQLFLHDDEEEFATKEDFVRWQKIKDSHVDNFMMGLKSYFVNVETGFAGSCKFVEFLSSTNVAKENRLLLISTHPILEDQASKVMERFSQICSWLNSGNPKVADLENQINSGTFNSEFLPWDDQNKNFLPWDVLGMDPIIGAFFNTSYYVGDFVSLLKFIRNIYEHRKKLKLSLDDIFKEIQVKWPYLHYQLHEYLLP